MFAELVKAIGDLKAASMKAETQEFNRMKDRRTLAPDGSVSTELADFPDRAHVAGDLSVIAKLVETRQNTYPDASIEAWYNRAGVTVIFDGDGYRRNRATMSLELSEEIRRLGAIAGKPMTQDEIIKTLRVAFRTCDFNVTVAALRNVKFEINQSGESTVERTKVSISKSQMARLYGLDTLAEDLTFTIPVFASKFRQFFNIAAALDPEPQTKTFTITPYPGQIEAAIEAAEEALGLDLEARLADSVPAYFGTP